MSMRVPPLEISVGIDLGTTTCALAMVGESGASEMILDEFGIPLTPSALFVARDHVQVGRDAIQASALDAEHFFEGPKRNLPGSDSVPSPPAAFAAPEFLLTCLLRHLKQVIERRVSSPYRCVVGVPAFFDVARRQQTIDAARAAGIPLAGLVNEPTAAALAYGEYHGYLRPDGTPREPQRVLVYDLGGGTFDVTVMELAHGEFKTLATDGDVRLGGNDWDQRLLDYFAQKFESRHRVDPRDDSATRLRLRRLAREIKESLSVRLHAPVRIEYLDRRLELDVTREQFELLTSDLLERTAHTTREILGPAGISWRDVDRVLLAGGATRMPMVSRMLRELTGQLPQQTINPDEAVARGAAIWGATRFPTEGETHSPLRIRVLDIAPHSLGIEGIDIATGRRENRVVIPRNAPLPAEVAVPFAIRRDDQESIVLRVLEGESLNPDECATIGHAILDHLPAQLRRGHPLQVVFNLRDGDALEVRLRLRQQDAHPGWTMRLERDTTGGPAESAWRQSLSGPGRFISFDELVKRILGV